MDRAVVAPTPISAAICVPYKGAGQVLQDLMGGQVQSLVKAMADALNSAEDRKRLARQGLEPIPNSPPQASQLVAAEMQHRAAVVKAAGIKAA